MRIALLTYSTKARGGVVASLCLAEALARSGHRVDVWTLARGGDAGFFRPVDPAVNVRAVPFPDREGETVGQRVLRSIDTLGAAFRAHTAVGPRGHDSARHDLDDHDHDHAGVYDIVHAQDCISANAVPECVRTVHHLDTFTTPELVACHERALRRPYAHVCVSAAVAAELAAGWGITAAVIPNGVEADRFATAASQQPAAVATRAAWRHRFGRYVLAVGGIEPRKGTLDLVEAMALLRDRATADASERTTGSAPALVIAGGETLFDYRDYRARVLVRAAELGVEPVLLGPVAHTDLPGLVAAADAFAFPSVKEGFGLAAMEALAAGVPVVTRDLPVLREVFGGAARFAATPAELAAELASALATPDPAPRAAGAALAARHSWDAAAAAHLRLYTRLLSTAPRAPAG
ncbi:MSMEG_0565 family glycosyltransferase [Frankia sp. CNm7]|uniref:MSMEG_0565 family glycosyltransferase n=1 Tax=Frankia nepalensis TaxID=1836974 RepID=A0A937RCV6_9ACTN|nr:MSMEG_0565 family glycosyltransferase [Frankia nepalensis]MBL7509935.1 MSMEG_0565 family glycosyltransferase [Frankia nepalensis]MBL7522701.1 MSMEG_0565 family glycosyltransferase [Frankia nepalensis]MBL7629781.1 MSMEG_0565 family glycosyltransferase [Frankia nepalensis]